MSQNINILIVHYNTPYLTSHLIKSIKKYTPSAKIYIFDNSDKYPFKSEYHDITIFDNTKGQYINFEKWLEKYPERNKSYGSKNSYASAKHCYTVDYCFELIPEGFILMDSDILLKNDVSEYVDESVIWKGEIIKHGGVANKDRVSPYICYINVKLCKEKGVRYFNENLMHGLYTTTESEKYDTGGSFLVDSQKYSHKIIQSKNYIIHYGAGSWGRTENSAKEWISKNWKLCTDPIYVSLTTHGDRCKNIEKTIRSLKTQTLLPDKIIICIHDSDYDKLPKSIFKDKTIEIIKYSLDIGPHAKYFYTMKKYRDNIIVTVDDDIEYSNDMLESLYINHLKYKDCVVARRVHLIKWGTDDTTLPYNQWGHEYKSIAYPSFDIFATGVGGVLYPKDCLKINDDCLYKILKVKYADDIYLKYRENELGIKCVWAENTKLIGKIVPGTVKGSLSLTNNLKGRNDEYLKIINLKRMRNKNVIYTCITGNYDTLMDPIEISEGVDYVCFTDSSLLNSNIWQIRPIPEELKNFTYVKQQRGIKINPHKYLSEYDLSIWVDANVTLKKDVNKYLEDNCKEGSVFIGKHPTRDCIYDEQKIVILMRKDTHENTDDKIKKYKEEGFPKHFGLVQSGIIIRRHNEEDCKTLMNLWWEELKNGSHRDQLSFDYARWKTPECKFVFLDKSIFNCEYFKWEGKHKPIKTKQNIIPSIEKSQPERQKVVITIPYKYNTPVQKNKISVTFIGRKT